jgi:hypothetical protein
MLVGKYPIVLFMEAVKKILILTERYQAVIIILQKMERNQIQLTTSHYQEIRLFQGQVMITGTEAALNSRMPEVQQAPEFQMIA